MPNPIRHVVRLRSLRLGGRANLVGVVAITRPAVIERGKVAHGQRELAESFSHLICADRELGIPQDPERLRGRCLIVADVREVGALFSQHLQDAGT